MFKRLSGFKMVIAQQPELLILTADAAASLDAETFERAGERLHAPSQSSAAIAVIAQA
jgi:hypothetical protein